MFKGSFVALITPMRADGSFDESSHALGDSVAVVRGDRVVFASGFGPADVEWAAPANARLAGRDRSPAVSPSQKLAAGAVVSSVQGLARGEAAIVSSVVPVS